MLSSTLSHIFINFFLHASVLKLSSLLLSFFKNQEGLVIKFGNKQSNRHYRVYTKNNILRFEFEFKDKNKLNYYHILLQQSHFEELERILSHQFFKYSFEIFSSAQQPDHIEY